MSIEKIFDRIATLIKEASIEAVVRWAAAIHNFIAPGYMLIFTFRPDVFDIGLIKLILLSVFFSSPITYVCYLVWGNRISKLSEENIEKTTQRIRILLFSTVTIFVLNFILAVYALFMSGPSNA